MQYAIISDQGWTKGEPTTITHELLNLGKGAAQRRLCIDTTVWLNQVQSCVSTVSCDI